MKWNESNIDKSPLELSSDVFDFAVLYHFVCLEIYKQMTSKTVFIQLW